MPLTLAQLLPAPDRTAWLGKLLTAAQGVGFVSKPTGIGTGTLSASGNSTVTEAVVVKITTAGEPGAAQYAVSLDGGVSFGSSATMPSNGTVVLGTSGVTLQFNAGPAGSGTSFVLGDTFALQLSTPNLPVSAWQPGSTPLTLLGVFADAAAELGRTAAAIAAGGLLKFSTGRWLALLADSFYDLRGNPGVVSHRTLRLQDIAGIGPVTLSIGQLWVGTVGGLRWTNTTAATVPLMGTGLGYVDVDFAAEQPGGKYNVGAGVITQFFTSFPGLSVGDPAGVATITTAGQDSESDPSIIQRCLARWPSLGVAAPNENYDLWAKTASANVTRTKVRPSPTVAGQVEVYLGGAAGAVDSGTVAAVNTYLQPRLGLTSTGLVQSAAQVTQDVTATVYCYTGFKAAVTAGVSQNVIALTLGGVDTEGELLPAVPINGVLYVNALIEQLETPQGVRNAVLTTPAADVDLSAVGAPGSINVLGLGTVTINVVEVSS